MLRQPDLPEQQRAEYAKTIMDASRRLSTLITNILKLNKLENQQIYPEKTVYDLGEQLCQCLLSFEDVWEEKNMELETDLAEGVLIESDPELPPLLTLCIAVPSFALVIYVLNGGYRGPLAYAVYVLSAYALVISITGGPGIIVGFSQWLKARPLTRKMLRIPLVKRFAEDVRFRAAFLYIRAFWSTCSISP